MNMDNDSRFQHPISNGHKQEFGQVQAPVFITTDPVRSVIVHADRNSNVDLTLVYGSTTATKVAATNAQLRANVNRIHCFP